MGSLGEGLLPTLFGGVATHLWHEVGCKHSTHAHESPGSRDPALTLHVDSGMAALPSLQNSTYSCRKGHFDSLDIWTKKERADTQIKAMDPLFKNLTLFCWQFSM